MDHLKKRKEENSPKTPLLNSNGHKNFGSVDDAKQSYQFSNIHSDLGSKNIRKTSEETPDVATESVTLKRQIGLFNTIAIVIGGVAGPGIFVGPTGVTENVGSVGLSLIIWTLGGIFNLVLAICYAELGSAIPKAGGDYYYILKVLGPVPAFLCLWITIIMLIPIGYAICGGTVAAYLLEMINLNCNMTLYVAIAIFANITAAALNAYSIKWTVRFVSVVSVAKLLALGAIIVIGIIKLAQGSTDNFETPWAGSNTDVGALVLGFLPGYAAYIGWDFVNTLAEEMKNPERDLPLSLSSSLILVTAVYVLTNVAYFTVLTPEEFVMSDAAATLFTNKVMPQVSWLIPVLIIFASLGTMAGYYLSGPRYCFAGGREGQLPQILCFIGIKSFTPLLSIIVLCCITIVICLLSFLDLQDLIQISAVLMQIKITMALLVLLRLKHKHPELPRTLKVPAVIVVISVLILLSLIILSVYQRPVVNGFGVLFFILGLPLYILVKVCSKAKGLRNLLDIATVFVQKTLLVVPVEKTN